MLVMSQPWRPPTMFEPGMWFRVPKVPLVTSRPSSPLIWLSKKLVSGLFGPCT